MSWKNCFYGWNTSNRRTPHEKTFLLSPSCNNSYPFNCRDGCLFSAEEIAVQWNQDGISGTASKYLVFVFPALELLVLFLQSAKPEVPEDAGLQQKGVGIVIPLLILGAQCVIVCNGLWYINVLSINLQFLQTSALLIAGLVIAYFGNKLPKFTRNLFCGIKTPYAYANDDLWTKTQRFAGKVWFGSGLILILLSLIPWAGAAFVAFAVIVLMILLPRLYSKRIYHELESK